MALGAVGNGLVEILDRLQSHTELGHKGLDQEGIGGDDAFIGGQRVALWMASRHWVMTSA